MALSAYLASGAAHSVGRLGRPSRYNLLSTSTNVTLPVMEPICVDRDIVPRHTRGEVRRATEPVSREAENLNTKVPAGRRRRWLRVLSLGGAGILALHIAVGEAAFTATSELDIIGRSDHTATLLPGGDVLVVGGTGPGQSAAGSVFVEGERYRAASGTFTQTGAARDIDPRFFHAATPLASGRVLVTGGLDPNNTALASTSIYDPTTGTWVGGPLLMAPRHGHTATLLEDGRILVVGGAVGATADRPGVRTASAELYDPATGTFSDAGRMSVARSFHTAVRLKSGAVLLAGGGSGPAEVFDPRTNRFRSVGTPLEVRRRHDATLLSDGRVVITGGVGLTSDGAVPRLPAAIEVFDPATEQFSVLGSLATPRFEHAALALPDGRILVAGGLTSGARDATATRGAEYIDTRSGVVSSAGSMVVARAAFTLTPLAGGRVLAIGGRTAALGSAQAARARTAEVFDPSTAVRSQLLSGEIPQGGFGLIVFGGGTNAALVESSTCPVDRLAFWVVEGGRFVSFIPAAPAGVNAAWNTRFPGGLPPGTALIGACRA